MVGRYSKEKIGGINPDSNYNYLRLSFKRYAAGVSNVYRDMKSSMASSTYSILSGRRFKLPTILEVTNNTTR